MATVIVNHARSLTSPGFTSCMLDPFSRDEWDTNHDRLIDNEPITCPKCLEHRNEVRAMKKQGLEVDMVNHPPHYGSHPKGIECIDVIEDADSPNLANAIKYIWRVTFGSKHDAIEDLKKAVWYINREIKRRELNKFDL